MRLRNTSFETRRSQVAMTLLEIMVAVSLLSLIVLTLYNMFDRTQKALRGTRNQSDVAEAGRAGMETLCREITQMRAISDPFICDIAMEVPLPIYSYSVYANSNPLQTNVLMSIYFNNFVPQATPFVWSGIAYRVAHSTNAYLPPLNGVGTLYRFVTNAARPTPDFYINYTNAVYYQPPPYTDYFQRVCDGVIHFNIRPYTNGAPDTSLPLTRSNTQMLSHVEVELGILPPSLVEQVKAFPAPADQINFLTNKGDKIQMFRQLVPIQTSPR